MSISISLPPILSIILLIQVCYNTKPMNNRQIELQTIIRNLQNKILIQKQQNKILSERYDQRVRAIEDESIRKLHEKQRMVEYLTMELDKDRQIIMNQQYIYDTKRIKEKEEVLREYERYKQKSYDLEHKLQLMIEKYELEKKDLENQIKKYQEKEYDQSFSRASIETEIEKLNKFYHQSRVDQPKRRELVEWVEKLSNLIKTTENQNSNTLQELFSYIKNNLESFKAQLLYSLTNASEFQQQTLKTKREILSDIKEIIKEQTKTKYEMMQSNQKLFQILKKEKVNTQNEKLQELEKELIETKKKANQNHQELTNRIKILEGQRKTLLLGFTELKTLNENREKTYKQEINALKETIEQLLSNGQRREAEFEQQMKILHSQLTSISQRYYQNIEFPLSKMTSKLDHEIKVARTELQKLSENKGFIKSIQTLQESMQSYIAQNSSNAKINNQMKEYITKTRDMIYWAQQICQAENERQLYSRSIDREEEQESRENVNSLHQKINSIESNIKEVEWRERENKLIYELTTAKKYNKRLKEHCEGLEGKANADRNVSPIKKSRIVSSSAKSSNSNANRPHDNSAKIFELQAEIERLTLLNKGYSDEYLYQLNLIKEHIEKLTGKEVKDEKNLLLMQKGIKEIAEFNEKVESYLQRENDHMLSIREILSTINRLLLKPVEIFDSFVERLTNCYQTPSLSPFKINKEYVEHTSITLFSNLQQIYKEISSKRQENNAQTNKLFVEFIKLLRETTPSHPKLHKTATVESDKQPLEKSRIGVRESAVDKKIKDLQSLRMKSREETIKRLEKIEQSLKLMQAKYSKRHFTNLTRVQQSITRKIDELREKCLDRLKQNNSDINEITGTVLKDIKNKLKYCMSQNQGLTRQVQLLQKFKKKE